MSRYAIYLASASAFALTSMLAFSGCGDECSRAGDCGSNQICYLGTCSELEGASTPCSTDMDCNPSGGDQLRCFAGHCTFKDDGTGPVVFRDGGPPRDGGPAVDGGPGRDGGPRDGGPPGRDGGPRDGGPNMGGSITVDIDGVTTTFGTGAYARWTATPTAGTTLGGMRGNGDTIEMFAAGNEPAAGNDSCMADATPGTHITLVQGGTTYMTGTVCTISITAHGPAGVTLMGAFNGQVSSGTVSVALTNGTMSIPVTN